MRKFFRLVDDLHIAKRWHLGEVFESGATSIELWNGTVIRGGKPLIVRIDRSGSPLEFCLTSFAAPIAETALGAAIAPIAGADLQRLPVVIDGNKNYEALNSVRVIECLDEAESDFTKWTQNDHRPELAGQYRMVTELKVESRRVPPDGQYFRVEGWRIALIVSQAIRSAMEEVGCRGALFQDVT